MTGFSFLGCAIPLKGKLNNSKENPFQSPTDTLLFGNTDAETSSGTDLWNGGISSGYVQGNIFCQYLLWPTDAKPKTVSPQNDSHLYMRQHTEIAHRSADCIVSCPTAYWLLFRSFCLRKEFPQSKHEPTKLKYCMSCRTAAEISFHLSHLIDSVIWEHAHTQICTCKGLERLVNTTLKCITVMQPLANTNWNQNAVTTSL